MKDRSCRQLGSLRLQEQREIPVTAVHQQSLLGREVASGFEQGNVFEAMEIWRITDRCTSVEPDATETQNIYTIQRWSDCEPGAQLDFALHQGGHSIPKGWAKMAMDWFEAP